MSGEIQCRYDAQRSGESERRGAQRSKETERGGEERREEERECTEEQGSTVHRGAERWGAVVRRGAKRIEHGRSEETRSGAVLCREGEENEADGCREERRGLARIVAEKSEGAGGQLDAENK